MNIVPRIRSLATAVPPFVLDQAEVARQAARHFAGSFGDFSRLEPVFANAEIETRYSCVPMAWYGEPHSFAERNRCYVENAVELLAEAATAAVERAGLELGDIGGIVTVSSTGIATPSLDALLMERLSLRRDTLRLRIFGLGCAGGVIGLARTAALARAEPDRHFLFLVVELCGLTFRNTDFTKSNVVATALFGDGAAAAVVGCAGQGFEITAWGEYTWPHSLDVMGWRVLDDGFGVLFSQDIPDLVRGRVGEACRGFLERHGLGLADIDTFICHPGGPKVLAALEEVFGLAAGGLDFSRRVLRRYGNMSAVTALFVLDEVQRAGRRGTHLMSALGPGFTCGLMTLRAT